MYNTIRPGKRSLAALLAVFMLASLTACAGSPAQPEMPAQSAQDTAPSVDTPAAEAPAAPEEPAAAEPEATAEPEEPPEETPEEPAPWTWQYDTPESQGMRADALAALRGTYTSFPLRASVIVRNGTVVDTYFADGYDETSVFTLQSVSKSITSALVGIAIEQGYIGSVDDLLADYLPRVNELADARWQRVTLRHLLAHTSGLASTDSALWYEWRASDDWLEYLFALPFYTDPGANFDYSTGNTHLLAAVLEQATGQPLGDYASEVLFQPLGMDSAGVGVSPEGVGDGGNGFYMTTLDLARFGLLYLNGGIWQGEPVVPADWVSASMTTQAQRASDGSRYGYQWWVRTFSGHEAFVAQGHYGQYIIAVPDLSLLLAMNSDYEGASSVYWQIANDAIAACTE